MFFWNKFRTNKIVNFNIQLIFALFWLLVFVSFLFNQKVIFFIGENRVNCFYNIHQIIHIKPSFVFQFFKKENKVNILIEKLFNYRFLFAFLFSTQDIIVFLK